MRYNAFAVASLQPPHSISPVNLNVHGAHVPHLPVEELGNVYQLQRNVEEHPECQRSPIDLHVLVREAHCSDAPEHHTPTAVCHEFHVPTEDVRVEVVSPVVVEYE